MSLPPAKRLVVAATMAVVLLVAGLAPSLPLVWPPVAHAAEYSLKTAASYQVEPGAGRVLVSVEVTFRNTTPNPPGQFSVFPTIDLALHAGATRVRAEDGRGRHLRTTVRRRDGVTVASVRPRSPARYRDERRFTLTYTLADGASRDVRIRPSVVIVPIWSFGTAGTVNVRLPRDYEVLVDGDALRAEEDGDAWRLESGSVPDPTRWLARLTATLPSSYVTSSRQVELSGGTVEVQVRSWSDDPAWGRRTLRLLTEALPRLDEAIGLPYRPTGPLVIVESLPESDAVLREPAASDVDIAIGYTEPAFTVLHQVAHLWLPPMLAGDRWIREGFASHAAAQVAAVMDVELPFDPERDARDRDGDAFPLVSWGVGDASPAQERYAYAAAWMAADAIAETVGEDALRLAWQRTAAGLDGYQPPFDQVPSAPVAATVPADSRHFLDQLQAVSDEDVLPVFRRWVLDEASTGQLTARRDARAAYAELVAVAADWGTPDPVRLALAGWRFDDAQAAISEATDWLADRDALLARIQAAGLTAPERLRAEYQRGGGSEAARRELDSEAAVVAAYEVGRRRAAADRSPLAEVGLLGGDAPDAMLAEAESLFADGDLVGAADLAAGATERLDRAASDGIVRILSVLVLVGVLVMVGVRQARRRGGAGADRYTARP
ncbi:MAG TPA: hypothetical protein VFY43_00175 [Candidatus Limnocylindria bacterium]|nr:hypothetical protein [Candidatus Limnocylindria bacterium]